jgi:2-dehydropantoate 2-reductase
VLTTTFDVIKNTAKNYSSMQQDVKNKKTTEIDSINGFLLDCAKKHGINCPHHQAVYQGIKAISC